MKRLIKLPEDSLGNKMNYVLQKEYAGFGIYKRKSQSGFLVHQDYLISNDKIKVQCPSFNHLIVEELLDAIDEYNNGKEFGFKAFKISDELYLVHSQGNMII